jgi:hypothetical protein
LHVFLFINSLCGLLSLIFCLEDLSKKGIILVYCRQEGHFPLIIDAAGILLVQPQKKES